jgi:hypothetical protein
MLGLHIFAPLNFLNLFKNINLRQQLGKWAAGRPVGSFFWGWGSLLGEVSMFLEVRVNILGCTSHCNYGMFTAGIIDWLIS